MAREHEVNPVNFITVGTIGPPGERVFHLQAGNDDLLVTLTIEKQQADRLADALLHLIEEVGEKLNLPPANARAARMDMQLHEPIQPIFRVAQMGLNFDQENDRILIVAQELQAEDAIEEPDTARFTATRDQMLAFCAHAKEVVSQGRPICPLCGEAEDPAGHFCPRRNGHSERVTLA